MKILFLTTVLPSARRTGGEIASEYFIDALEKNNHNVLVLGYQRQGDKFIKQANEFAIARRYIETNKSGLYPIMWLGTSFSKRISYSCGKYYSQVYIHKLKKLLNQTDFDAVIVDHAQMGWLLATLKSQLKPNTKIIFIAHNVENQIYGNQLQSATSYLSRYMYQRESKLIKICEDNLAATANSVWTLTENDSKYFAQFNQETQVFHLPSSLKTLENNSIQKHYDVGIIGTWTWKANMQGLVWFFQTVYPHLPKNLSIHVAGKGAETICADYQNVKYRGFVPDAQQFMSEARTIAIPSVSGGGVQIKTLDAIASGVPVVATPIALRGVTEFPSCVQVAEKPEDFARNLSELLTCNTQSETDIATQLFQERLIWSQKRQEHFYQDISKAIGSSQTESNYV